MALPESRVVNGSRAPTADAGIRVFHAYGEPDDPLRLLVLLAEHVASLQGLSASRCLDPTAAWRSKRDELDDLLDGLWSYDHTFAVIVDLDALAPTPRNDWEDPLTHRMQADIFDLICRAIDRGGWIVVRPSPAATVSERLSAIVAEETSSDIASIDTLVLAPDVRPMAQWLVTHGRLLGGDLQRILESESHPNDRILSLACSDLTPQARQLAQRVSILRPPFSVNGAFGPFSWGSTNGDFEVSREGAEDLCDRGLLQEDRAGSHIMMRMPRNVRHEVGSAHADWTERAHRWLAERDQDTTNTEEIIEAHYHAARSGNLELAKKTAKIYGYELRMLATHLSRERDFKGAAELFLYLVENFSSTDAYAWEYLGYNLARWDQQVEFFGRHHDEIRQAYLRAHELDPNNPLYHGRWLGFQAECRIDISGELSRGIAKYLRDYGAREDAISWFTMPVLDGLQRSKRATDLDDLISRWRPVLEKHAPRVLEKHSKSDAGEIFQPHEARAPARFEDWLDDVYAFVAAKDDERAVELVFDTIDDLLLEGRFQVCDDTLRAVDVERLNPTLLLALLSITLAAKDRLHGREALLKRIERRLRTLAPERVEELLHGLR
jgi:hypothetical protein